MSVTLKDLVDAVAEFLEAFVHQVLWLRGLYPEDLFERRKLYSCVVKKSRHPELNNHIKGSIDTLHEALHKQLLRRFAVAIVNASGQVVERHVVDTQVSLDPQHCRWDDLTAAVRGCLVKHQYSIAKVAPLPPGCTFEVVAYTLRQPSNAPPVNLQLWVEEGPSGGPGGANMEVELPRPFTLQPVKSVMVQGLAALQVYLETP